MNSLAKMNMRCQWLEKSRGCIHHGSPGKDYCCLVRVANTRRGIHVQKDGQTLPRHLQTQPSEASS